MFGDGGQCDSAIRWCCGSDVAVDGAVAILGMLPIRCLCSTILLRFDAAIALHSCGAIAVAWHAIAVAIIVIIVVVAITIQHIGTVRLGH